MCDAAQACIKHVDETSWYVILNGARHGMFATALVSVFRIAADGKTRARRYLLAHLFHTLLVQQLPYRVNGVV